MEYVYHIRVNGIVRYIGRTNNIKRREAEHNHLCFVKKTPKELYSGIRNYPSILEIKIIVTKVFDNKVQAKRWECFLILKDYFGEKKLWQRVPRITDI